jgi:hypothetical protein
MARNRARMHATAFYPRSAIAIPPDPQSAVFSLTRKDIHAFLILDNLLNSCRLSKQAMDGNSRMTKDLDIFYLSDRHILC